jgi:transcriptional regulator with XRE-family HTH domain
VDREIKERKWTRAKLAEEAGIAPSLITEMLNGSGENTSRHLHRIHAAFGWPPPKLTGSNDVDPVRSKIDADLDKLDKKGLEIVRDMIERMTSGKTGE